MSTLLDARNSRIPSILNVCKTDPKVPEYTNKAQRMALKRGRWWGTYQVIQLCVQDSCLTWPRQVARVEKLDVCNRPIPVRNAWWEFLENSDGRRPGDPCGELNAVPRGTSPMFADITGLNKVLRVYPTHPSDVGKTMIFQGYDQNAIWIRTEITPGTWIEGFQMTLTMPYSDSPMVVSAITGVQRDMTNHLVRVYEHDTILGTDRALAIYEPSETAPKYVRSFLSPFGTGSCRSNSTGPKSVVALVKLEYIPAILDSDYLIIGNIDALENIVQAIKMKEGNNLEEAAALMKAGLTDLNHELRTYTGDQTSIQVSVFGTASLNRVMGVFR